MTIASEISRLQNAKAGIRQAIIDKGVSVSTDLTIDDYACCIAAIQKGMQVFNLKYMLVGGGGGGGGGANAAGGGGGGGVKFGNGLSTGKSYTVSVGAGGCGGCRNRAGCNGCPSSITDSAGILTDSVNGGWGGSSGGCGMYYSYSGCSGNGCPGGKSLSDYCGGGGGGAGGNGYDSTNNCGGNGGLGLCGYAGGGGGGASYGNDYIGKGCCGGGNGGITGNGCNATYYGGGGGGSGSPSYSARCCKGGNGYQGLVKICYQCDASCSGVTCATGGSKSTVTEGGIVYCMHTFTSNGTFCIVC